MIKIKDWSATYENSDTRKRQRLGWFLTPSGTDSKGYRMLMREGKNGLLALGVFSGLCQYMATMDKEVRKEGTFRNSDGSVMDMADVWEVTRMNMADAATALELLKKIGWIELICQESATSVPQNSGFVKGKGKGKGKGKEEASANTTDLFLNNLWKATPSRGRTRSSVSQMNAAWKAVEDKPDFQLVLDAMEKWKVSHDWIKDGGEYIQGLHLWIKNRKWENTPEHYSQPKRQLRL